MSCDGAPETEALSQWELDLLESLPLLPREDYTVRRAPRGRVPRTQSRKNRQPRVRASPRAAHQHYKVSRAATSRRAVFFAVLANTHLIKGAGRLPRPYEHPDVELYYANPRMFAATAPEAHDRDPRARSPRAVAGASRTRQVSITPGIATSSSGGPTTRVPSRTPASPRATSFVDVGGGDEPSASVATAFGAGGDLETLNAGSSEEDTIDEGDEMYLEDIEDLEQSLVEMEAAAGGGEFQNTSTNDAQLRSSEKRMAQQPAQGGGGGGGRMGGIMNFVANTGMKITTVFRAIRSTVGWFLAIAASKGVNISPRIWKLIWSFHSEIGEDDWMYMPRNIGFPFVDEVVHSWNKHFPAEGQDAIFR
eukprot:g5602.t1